MRFVTIRAFTPVARAFAARASARYAVAMLILGLTALSLTGCMNAQPGSDLHPQADGKASYYADRLEGNPTANGEIYDGSKLTAAHRTLPFGTMVRVTRVDTGDQVTVRINDRGPQRQERIVDLSRRAAEALNMIHAGIVDVRLEVLD
ncbi:MAG: septal ring lytic transglycosylase RlpA family protein [Longimonas sp.]|uniref:septal ring lytic transglycosylase RlpA family protein n=1 Tax=Longimonas sp. TaxID=2039626 RepID=UPI00334E1457